MKPFPNANVNNLQEYIKSISGLVKTTSGLQRDAFPFITISRQTGAGGHTLAEAILKELEATRSPVSGAWQILDQDLCQKVMDDPKLYYPMQWLLTERFEKEFIDYLAQMIAKTSPQIAVYHKIFRIIRTFATAGKVIVVGRAGAFITKDLPLGIHVRLVAPRALRIQNMMRVFGMRKGEAEVAVQDQDAARALLVRRCIINRDISDPLNYDMVWNTERVPIPAIASVLVQMANQKASESRAANEAGGSLVAIR